MPGYQDTRIETCSNCPGRAMVSSEPEPGTSQSRTRKDTFRSLASQDDVFSLFVFPLSSFLNAMNIHGSINIRVVCRPDSQHVPVPCLDRSISTSPQPHLISPAPSPSPSFSLSLSLTLSVIVAVFISILVGSSFSSASLLLFFSSPLPYIPSHCNSPTAVRLPLHSSRTSLLYSYPP